MFESTFNNKKVLVTGHTGFKGSWLCSWLNHLGAEVLGISDDLVSNPSNYSASLVSDFIKDYRLDIRDTNTIVSLIKDIRPDFVFHLAAQSLVRPSYESPIDTMTTNAIGSANILDALRSLEKKVVAVMITSDKAYDNVEWVWGYRETDRLGGKDPYSASKGMAELAIRSYVSSFFNSPNSNIRVGIARAGNVIGGGDWAVDRIVPDCMKAWANGKTVDIRSPHATRPWQHVLEPLSGYLCLAENLFLNAKNHGEAYNFGPSADQNYPVSKLIDEMSKHWDQIKWNDVSKNEGHVHEAGLLKLNCDKALFGLEWNSALQFEETVQMTVDWYKEYYQNRAKSMHDFTISQIDSYTKAARLNNIYWANDD
ncbi:CDP-glucose 4,6-dehydratase [Candidatus Thioglobus sp.]|jgi:CDP-glucose 4,6-dehydratase|nr:CDP-glucose 4,6-dehydratase [Candidatus Thioglobus sp.]